MRNNALEIIALILIVIGAINWGLVGIFNFNFVDWVVGAQTVAAQVIYIVIGVCGLYGIAHIFKD